MPGSSSTISWSGPLRCFPDGDEDECALVELHTDALVKTICEQMVQARDGHRMSRPSASPCPA